METQLFYTEKELAGVLRCSVPAVRQWRREGMPAVKLAKLVRYQLPEVLEWFGLRKELTDTLQRE